MDLHTGLTCLTAVTLLTLTPGIDTLLVIRNSLRGGWRDGILSSLGICSGLFVHALISALGISLVLLQTAWAFALLKMVGALYLIFLGLSGIYSAIKKEGMFSLPQPLEKKKSFSALLSFREGFLSNILNPKAVIFYLAFLPQFISPAKNELVQSMLVASMHFTVAMIYGLFLAVLSDKTSSLFSSPLYTRVISSLSGSFLILLGIKLALEE